MIWRSAKTAATAPLLVLLLSATANAALQLPKIKNVTFSGSSGNYSATITGKNFGVAPDGIPCNACQPLQVQIVDIASQPVQQVINVTNWSDTSITVTGIAVNKGDSTRIGVYNQTLGNVDTWGGPVIKQKNNTPVISGLAKSGEGQNLTLTITGSGFGSAPAGIGDNFESPFFVFTSYNSQLPGTDGFPWNAGYCGANDCNAVTVNISSWNDKQIVMDGFGDMYGNDWIVNPKDAFCVGVWSSQSTSDGTTGGTYACKRAPK
ncbi:MAG TPA: hypothetical protein VHW69_02875 [Rhizomicrobium sp.]|jgi:hypothetical protein|nr:hypothetical protein [Rhizomicrobium sp.]